MKITIKEPVTLPKNVESNRSPQGKDRYYYREGRRGPRTRLLGDPSSPEFAEAYRAAAKGVPYEAPEEAPQFVLPLKPYPNTVQQLFNVYLKHEAFTGLDETTQTKRLSIMEKMMREPLSATDGRLFGCMPLSKFDTEAITVLKLRKKDTPFAADERLKVLRQIMEVGCETGLIKVNYAKTVSAYREKTEGHETATPEELQQYINHHGKFSKASLAVYLMMYTGVRVSDLLLLGPQNRRKVGNQEFLIFQQFKGRKQNPMTITVKIEDELATILNHHKFTNMRFLVTDFGQPFASAKSLGNRVEKWFEQAGLPHLSAHCVRKGGATNLAENDATEHQLMALYGWSQPKTAAIYTKKANTVKLATAAVSKFRWGVN